MLLFAHAETTEKNHCILDRLKFLDLGSGKDRYNDIVAQICRGDPVAERDAPRRRNAEIASK
jgi:hypothetical protein